MTVMEEKVIQSCVVLCANAIHRCLKLFKNLDPVDKSALKEEIYESIQKYLKELENANRN